MPQTHVAEATGVSDKPRLADSKRQETNLFHGKLYRMNRPSSRRVRDICTFCTRVSLPF